ncbi:MAG: dihydrofolate reductase family protein [Planctomycetota bacterium]
MIRALQAVTLDGFIADEDGEWPFHDRYDAVFQPWWDEVFLPSIGAVVLGRTTYEQYVAEDWWPYDRHAIPTFVQTTRGLESGASLITAFAEPAELEPKLDALGARDVWLGGGGRSIASFDRAGLIDRWELYIVPERLGRGIPVFPGGVPACGLALERCRELAMGVAELWYTPRDQPEGA